MATVSLPSIHEMFPAHLICRDEFATTVPRSRARPPPPSSSLPSTCSGPSSSTAGPSHVRMPHLPTHPPAHLHAHAVAHSAHTPTSRAYGSSSGHAPISAANTSSRRSSFAGAQSHPHAHAGTTAPGAPSERRPPHVHHPYSYPHDERQRRHSYQQHLPPSTHQHQHQHYPMDTNDGEEDASEGSIGGSPMPVNAQVPSMPMHAQGYPAIPHHHLGPGQGHPGMSVMPMPPPMNEGDGVPSGKKHVCPTCFKRFNRPSSLRIHVNTHTGATRQFYYSSSL
ncbi:unnamed protein product [Cyclocybe aegerita]|uniref:C2H2-type domain-containing protein n=1 Tax=Cyclocybe aegerita TaxID=1973307 RepID=A0A8S0WGA0_CYCAE|nr:unnamed protein product [Cyclocybe aegerita]